MIDWSGQPGPSAWLALWNIIGDMGIFAIFAVTLSRISSDLAGQRQLNEELHTALAQVKTLSGLLPICAWCNKIRDESGEWRRLEHYLTAHGSA